MSIELIPQRHLRPRSMDDKYQVDKLPPRGPDTRISVTICRSGIKLQSSVSSQTQSAEVVANHFPPTIFHQMSLGIKGCKQSCTTPHHLRIGATSWSSSSGARRGLNRNVRRETWQVTAAILTRHSALFSRHECYTIRSRRLQSITGS